MKHIFDRENVRVGCEDDFLERANEVGKSQKKFTKTRTHKPTSAQRCSARMTDDTHTDTHTHTHIY